MDATATSSRRDVRRLWVNEASGSVADLGVLVPIAIALIVTNGVSATAALLPAGIAYLVVARVYRLPIAVQPLKAFGAAAIAAGAGVDVIAAGALLMGAIFILLGASRTLDWAARIFPPAVIAGVQLAVGLTFLKIAWGLVSAPSSAFVSQLSPQWVFASAVAIAAVLVWRKTLILVVVAIGLLMATVHGASVGGLSLGPSMITFPVLSFDTFAVAAALLVLPQLPLTFANSCLAPPAAAQRYFGESARRVTPTNLALTLGATNVLAGAVSGMPICHGAGGLSAHVDFGARTWRAPLIIGTALLTAAILVGASLAIVLPAFPLSILAALLALAAVAHIRLLGVLVGRWQWCLAICVGVVGVATNLAWAVIGGLALYFLGRLVARSRAD